MTKSADKKTNETTRVKVTVKGIDVTVDKELMNDIDAVELFGELQDGNIFAFPKLAKRVFGDQYPKVKKALENKDGVTTATDMVAFFAELMKKMNEDEAKN